MMPTERPGLADLKPRPGLPLVRGKRAECPETGTDAELEGFSGRVLCCALCDQAVTRPEARCRVDGKHMHVFCNPHGVVFEVGCFSLATGLMPEGERYSEFSWFPGHEWQIMLCARCGEHLGWRFTARSGGGFYGLLPGKLREQDGE